MQDLKFLYKVYSEQLQYKIQFCIVKEKEYENAFNYLKGAIRNQKDEFDKYDISIDSILNHPSTAYSKISQLVTNGNLTRVASYVKSYASAYRYYSYFNLTRKRLENCILPFNIFREIIFAINRELATYVLEGNILTLSILGKIFIVEKENKQYAEYSKPVGSRIDWGATVRNKKQLLNQNIPLYNEKLNPDGTKYFKYHNNDFDYWFYWMPGAVLNRGKYRFYPNSYLHNIGRSVDAFVSKAKSIDDILNTTAIGVEDRMRALLRFDKLYYLRYRRPDFDGKRFVKLTDFNTNFLQQSMMALHKR